jgi:uncharacterized protein YjbI with pentapeptide repeats
MRDPGGNERLSIEPVESPSELIQRWNEPERASIPLELATRLARGKPLSGLTSETINGRVDLRGLALPAPRVKQARRFMMVGRNWDVGRLTGVIEIKGAHLDGVDLSYSSLPNMKLHESRIENSRFDRAKLNEVGFWGCTIRRTSFVGASLRAAVLGGSARDQTEYDRIDFQEADLRDAVVGMADFADCNFSNAKLNKVEFYGSRITRCTFAGQLREVIFQAAGLGPEHRQGSLEDVDFSQAHFRWVGLRGFDLNRVTLPAGPDHVIFSNYQCVLERAIASLQDDTEDAKLSLLGLLEHEQRWLGPNQRRGVLAIADLHPDETPQAGIPAATRLKELDAQCAGQ